MNKNMELQKHLNTPLYTALKEYASKDIIHFDVPGHKKRRSQWLAEALGDNIIAYDANSTKDLDMLSKPSGPIKEAEQLMAEAYHADHAFFLVNGSTSGVQYMIMSACKPNDKIIMPRNVHKSAINALILSGAFPVFVEPEIDTDYGISNGIAFETIEKAISENPDAKAVFIINPTYFGVASDLKGIIELAHQSNMSVLVDEAHGAHLPFHAEFPACAMALGADMATVSTHKTAGSLTQSSVLLLNEHRIRKHQVRTVINLMQTTSASYLLMASLDLARHNLVLYGHAKYDALLQATKAAKVSINAIPGMQVISKDYIDGKGVIDYDETKLVIKVNELGLSGFEVYDLLFSEYNIQLELAETYVVLAVVGIGDDEDTISHLVEALRDLSKRFYKKRPIYTVESLRVFKKPKMILAPREAHYKKKILVSIDESIGRISGESIMIYPPGIPLVVPGEIISAAVINHYKYYRKQGCVMINDEESSGLIKVLNI